MRAPFVKHASGGPKGKPPTFRRLVENFAFLPHRAEAHHHRALQVGWSRFRAVLMQTYILAGLTARENGTISFRT